MTTRQQGRHSQSQYPRVPLCMEPLPLRKKGQKSGKVRIPRKAKKAAKKAAGQ